ncbi:MAG: hypothetical protein OP8BY_0687 [Candidatus Saccharicenans subterraneus]|uniref:Uncharacterized protein n=1 Tax=Candidatus Saccharicenans subterraneus TaxID=2508984 RepID=A0A3E2BKB1_9BACT|nr:MAG: hypothetical protein OP8BY_0687 [Candidatus Saccharicenans subterraneum]
MTMAGKILEQVIFLPNFSIFFKAGPGKIFQCSGSTAFPADSTFVRGSGKMFTKFIPGERPLSG